MHSSKEGPVVDWKLTFSECSEEIAFYFVRDDKHMSVELAK